MNKRIVFMLFVAVLMVAFSASYAMALEGYNDGVYTQDNGYFSGPHGGYTTTTAKCAACHSTHTAQGSFSLLRANSREAACDYCHGGGAGSGMNIMMDNEYRDYVDGQEYLDGSAIATTTAGMGTGHTLGFTGNAPTDIKPAYTDAEGLACFDCHSPHGNSSRVLTTFSDPGRALGTGANVLKAGIDAGALGNSTDGVISSAGEWGIDPEFGNFKWFSSGKVVWRPIWPSGRFLLLKDPHSTAQELVADDVVASVGTTATAGVNKYAIDWEEPLGPADGGYGGYQDNDNDNTYPFAKKQTVDTDGNGQLDGGFLAESEFCVDCHDGTGGASTQAAEVWNPETSQYDVVYSHDTQPRH